MLNVAFDELPSGGAQEMAASLLRVCECQRRAILKLVAEAVGAACLIEGGARHDAAGQRLIEQPAVQQDVHGAIRRLDLDRAEQCPPVLRHLVQNGVEIGRPVAADEGRGFFGCAALSEEPDDFGRFSRGKVHDALQGGTGVEPGAGRTG